MSVPVSWIHAGSVFRLTQEDARRYPESPVFTAHSCPVVIVDGATGLILGYQINVTVGTPESPNHWGDQTPVSFAPSLSVVETDHVLEAILEGIRETHFRTCVYGRATDRIEYTPTPKEEGDQK